jgi:hypothetical protein
MCELFLIPHSLLPLPHSSPPCFSFLTMASRHPTHGVLSLPSRPHSLGELTGFLWFVYNSDACRWKRNLPPHPLLQGIVSGADDFVWNYHCGEEMARLEAFSGVSYAEVAGIVNRPSTDLLRGVAVIRKDCGCVQLDLCDCAPTNSNGGGTKEVIKISSDTSFYVTAEGGESDAALVGSNRQF